MNELKDFTGQKISAIKNTVRADLSEMLFEFFSEKFETVKRTGAGEIALFYGEYTDEDGCPHDVPAVIKVIAKSFYDKDTDKDGVPLKREVESYDLISEAEEYERKVTEKKNKAKKD